MSRSDVLVTADWAQENLGTPGLVFVEVDEDTSAYDGGHLEGAVKLDWKKDLQDTLRRDFVDKAGFEKLLSERGIGNDDTVILYGGNNNWFAAYAYWYFKLYGHENVKLLDRKSTRLNSSHANISYAVFCLKKKNNKNININAHIQHCDNLI